MINERRTYKGENVFQLLKTISALDPFRRQLPLLLVSLFIASSLYRVHSFLLESVAFLGTWFLLDLLVQGLLFLVPTAKEQSTRQGAGS